MKTSEIINALCAQLDIPKAELAKRMGMYPSSLYRKMARESMSLEELQQCLDALEVSMELSFHLPDGNALSSQSNHNLVLERVNLLETELAASARSEEFLRKSFRELRTELHNALGYLELSGSRRAESEAYLVRLRNVLTNMEHTIACALGDALQEEAQLAEPVDMDALRGKRVLLVEDNRLNRDILKALLEDNGLLVDAAPNGSRAVADLKMQPPGYYFCILMDIEMPMMDGFEAAMTIRRLSNRIRSNTPIIALTANADPENRKRAAMVGMDGFLMKPVNSSRLLAALVRLL